MEAEATKAVSLYEGRYSPRVRLSLAVTPEGIVLAACERRLSSLDVPGGPVLATVKVDPVPLPAPGPAKPIDRSPWDGPLRRAQAAGADQAVLVGSDGTLADGSTATVWAVKDDVLLTPVSPPAIPGVARAWLMEQAGGLGLRVEVCALTEADLRLADELFLTNALAGAVAVRGRGGPVTATVIAAFARLWETSGSPG